MAQLGHPGKFTYCLAEAEEVSPWAPLHTTLGNPHARPGRAGRRPQPRPRPCSRLWRLRSREPPAELANRAVRQPSETWLTRSGWIAATPPPQPSYAEPGSKGLYAVADPGQILILIAGGEGTYSAVMPSWGVGPHNNTFVTQEIVLAQACEITRSRGAGQRMM